MRTALAFNEFNEPIAHAKQANDAWDGARTRVPWQKIRMLGPGPAKTALPIPKPPKDTPAERLAKRRAIIKFLAERRRQLQV